MNSPFRGLVYALIPSLIVWAIIAYAIVSVIR